MGGSAPFWEGDWVSIYHKVGWAEAYICTKWHLDASSRLATIEMGRKLERGLCPPFGEGEPGLHLRQSRLGRGLLNSTQRVVTDAGVKCEHLFVRISITLIYIYLSERSLIYHQFQ